MFIFGHLGIGEAMVKPVGRTLPRRWLLLGTILPDLIDKPLYYGLRFATGLHGAELGLISGTRTFGHTGLFLLILAGIAWAKRSRVFAALALGVATHLLLDGLADIWIPYEPGTRTLVNALFFPFMGFAFPVIPYHYVGEHLRSIMRPMTWMCEILGLLMFSWENWKRRHSSEIIAALAEHRHRLRLRRSKLREQRRGKSP